MDKKNTGRPLASPTDSIEDELSEKIEEEADKSKMVRFVKSFMLKKGDTPTLIAHLEDICAKVERLTLILRNPKFVNINLVSIPSEAGFQECFRTIQFLKKMEIPVGNIIVNNIMPNFGEEEWVLAEEHPSVGLVHREYVMQQPYLQRYRELCSEESLKLVGLSRLPFEPRGEKLGEVAKMLWRPGSLSWEPTLPLTETDTGYRVQLPFVGDAKWSVKKGKAKYQYEKFNFGQGDGWYEVPVEDVKRKRKINEDTVTLTTE